MSNCTNRSKLGVFALAMAIGISSGLGMLLLGLLGHFFQSGLSIITLYIGFEPMQVLSVMGAIIGGLWAFVEGAIWGAIIAALYNKCLCCPVCKASTCSEDSKKSV